MWDIIKKVPTIIKRVVFLGVIAAIFLFISLGVINHFKTAAPPPDAAQAPWMIQTSSRVYWGEQMKMVGSDPELNGYWTLENGHYVFHDKVIEFPYAVYGKVQIINRR